MNIKVSHYPAPSPEERAATEAEHPGVHWPSDTWDSYIQPEDGAWIVFVGTDGSLLVYGRREPSGAVIEDSRIEVPAPV